MSGRTYKNADAARDLGVNQATVKRWRARGWIVDRPDGSLDAGATRSRVDANRDPTLGGRPDRGVGVVASVQPAVPDAPRSPPRPPPRYPEGGYDSTSDATKLVRARALKETLQGKALRLSLEEREGRLIDRFEAERVYVECITEARARLEALPVRLGARLAGLDPNAIQVVLRDEIQASLRTVSRLPDIGTGEGGAS